ncbi:MAG: isochorismatase family protein [bacterium]
MQLIPPKLEKDRVALVVIDMQERFRTIVHDMPRVVASCSRLIRFCQALSIPILVTEHYPRGLGKTIPELSRIFQRFDPLEKITFSCLGDDGIQSAWEALDRDQAILCGIETHVCVYQTAYDLLKTAAQVSLAMDGISSRTRQDREIGLARLISLGCAGMSAEMIMFEILQRAQTEDFKAVSDILKE